MSVDPIAHWHALLEDENAGALCASLAERMRTRRLHFGGRPLCPFLRPFFLDAADEDRVRRAAETLWTLGERIEHAAMGRHGLLQQMDVITEYMRLTRVVTG